MGAEIARGGMGVIYHATDTALGREVAVKVLQDKYGPDSGGARRFADEARITAQLQHPAIPPVHDLGTLPDGRPFLAMKLIKGDTLDVLLKQSPSPLPGEKGRGAVDRGRYLAVFEQVCQALAYAHAHDVIHRDLKPANVMVGAFGEVQVMDWGLAKVLTARPAETTDSDETRAGTQVLSLRDSDESFTEVGSVLGTPAYMPPEQAVGAVGKVDRRSDVFGLGAVLAVILTGQPPFAAASAETVRVKSAQGKVEECFARLDGCGADPELIALCKRCLAPEPADRPADAGAVARAVADLRAAADERARRAELERVRVEGEKAAAEARALERRRRRRLWLGAAAALVLAALAGLGAVLAVEAKANRDLTAANVRERQANAQTRANFQLARQAVKEYCVRVSLDPRLKQADLSQLRKELLETAARFHDRFKEQESDDPDVQAERAYAYFELGFIANLIGSADEAAGHYRQALALWQQLVEAHPDQPGYRHGLASCYNDVANLYAKIGRPAEAEDAYRKCLALQQALADADPGDRAQQIKVASAHSNLALWLARRELYPEAEEHYGKALTILQALVDADRDNADYLRALADARHKLGFLYSWTSRGRQAGEAYQQALAIRQRLHQDHPQDARYQEDLAFSCVNLGQWYRNVDEPRKAEESLRQAVDLFQNLADVYPSVPDYQQDLANAVRNLALFYQANRQTQQAGEAYQRVLGIQEPLVKRFPANLHFAVELAGTYCNMGRRLTQNGNPQAALEWFDRAVAKLEEVGQRDRDIGRNYLRNTHLNRAEALLALDRPAEELEEWNRALALAPNVDSRAYFEMGRALALVRLGKYEEGVRVAEDLAGPAQTSEFEVFRAARVLARASVEAGRDARLGTAERRDQAEALAARAVALLQRAQSQGYFKKPANVAELQQDRNLDALRDRADFRKLLAELEVKAKDNKGRDRN
jgi:tetratricopeptide (TPR) repeat protein/tRNA A-37 threonylcarbamoyl transferase component Bud32